MRRMRVAHALLALLLPACCAAFPSAPSCEGYHRETVPADSTVVAFWPRDVDDTLSHARDPDGTVRLSSSSGRGFFGTVTSNFDTAVQIAWVPPVEAESTTFDQFFSQSPHLVAVHSVGIHIQVTPVFPIDAATFLSETKRREIEANVQNVLQEAFPKSGVLPQFQAGFLAKSLCSYQKWESNLPMANASDSSAASSAWCYTSSFSSPATVSTARGLLAFNKAVDATALTEKPPERESALDMYLRSKVAAFEYVRRVTQVTLEQSVSPHELSTQVFEAWTADSPQIPITWQYEKNDGSKRAARSLIVSSVRLEDVPSIEYLSLEQNGEDEMITKLSLVLTKNQFPDSVAPASVNVSVAGEGFHRRFSIDVNLHGAQQKCSESKQKLLLRVPLSHDVYADLDELRRMERFGELQLLAFSKHIEIERPSPVSPQHTVALEFPIPSSDLVHIEFPIHFRYQAPSESDLYRLASIVSPEFFLYCPLDRQSEPQVDHQYAEDSSADGLDAAYFQHWVVSSSRSEWQRLSVKSPIDVQDIAVPVGYLPHGPFVSIMTLSVASLGALLLVFIATTTKKPTSASSSSHWKLKSA